MPGAQLHAGIDLGAGADDRPGMQDGVAAGEHAVAEHGAELAAAGGEARRPAIGISISPPSWRKFERMVPAPRLTSAPSTESPT